MQSTTLPELAESLLTEARAAHSGRSAHTLFGNHEHHLRQTVIALAEGRELAEHNSPGEATLQVLAGHARLTTTSAEWDGRTGDHVVIGPERHKVTAVQDTVILLTVATA
ncbi:LuxR family transcriptional regulator [Actinoplanes sp. TRM 88003]|uniref:LuxR family transcriptional regulator n=1 Tax=Paractinoplanes aksuensis TaxID=2939490 RepID=A0ABT1DW50_9ACTN|nr:LuxR family transcriptional regulator [Actinoplanes aksuensis]MCO8275086.1 LuxR family transcriptional regulator [Actinoplanes aksuensis]